MMNKTQYEMLQEQVVEFSWLWDVYEGSGFLSDEERKLYRGIGLSKSSLDRINKSVQHYFKARPKSSSAMKLGSAFHCIVLEPEKFPDQYVLEPEINRRTKAGKEEWEAFETENKEKSVLSQNDWDTVHWMRDSVLSNGLACEMLDSNVGLAEGMIMWNDPITGVLMKGIFDFLNPVQRTIIDLKSTGDASNDKLEKDLWSTDMRYYVQAAIYQDGIQKVTKESDWDFHFIFVEKNPPFGTRVVRIPEKGIELGRLHYQENIERLIRWLTEAQESLEQNRNMPNVYPETIVELQPPAWLLKKARSL